MRFTDFFILKYLSTAHVDQDVYMNRSLPVFYIRALFKNITE